MDGMHMECWLCMSGAGDDFLAFVLNAAPAEMLKVDWVAGMGRVLVGPKLHIAVATTWQLPPKPNKETLHL